MAKKKVNPTAKGKYVRRALYQSLLERYKKLSADMKVVTAEGLADPNKIFLIAKYRKQYQQEQQQARALVEAIFSLDKKLKLPKEMEIGMYVVTKKGETVYIYADDMNGYVYEHFKRMATEGEIRIYKVNKKKKA